MSAELTEEEKALHLILQNPRQQGMRSATLKALAELRKEQKKGKPVEKKRNFHYYDIPLRLRPGNRVIKPKQKSTAEKSIYFFKEAISMARGETREGPINPRKEHVNSGIGNPLAPLRYAIDIDDWLATIHDIDYHYMAKQGLKPLYVWNYSDEQMLRVLKLAHSRIDQLKEMQKFQDKEDLEDTIAALETKRGWNMHLMTTMKKGGKQIVLESFMNAATGRLDQIAKALFEKGAASYSGIDPDDIRYHEAPSVKETLKNVAWLQQQKPKFKDIPINTEDVRQLKAAITDYREQPTKTLSAITRHFKDQTIREQQVQTNERLLKGFGFQKLETAQKFFIEANDLTEEQKKNLKRFVGWLSDNAHLYQFEKAVDDGNKNIIYDPFGYASEDEEINRTLMHLSVEELFFRTVLELVHKPDQQIMSYLRDANTKWTAYIAGSTDDARDALIKETDTHLSDKEFRLLIAEPTGSKRKAIDSGDETPNPKRISREIANRQLYDEPQDAMVVYNEEEALQVKFKKYKSHFTNRPTGFEAIPLNYKKGYGIVNYKKKPKYVTFRRF